MSLSDEVAVTKHLMKQWLGAGKVSLCEVQKLHVHVIVFQEASKHISLSVK